MNPQDLDRVSSGGLSYNYSSSPSSVNNGTFLGTPTNKKRGQRQRQPKASKYSTFESDEEYNSDAKGGSNCQKEHNSILFGEDSDDHFDDSHDNYPDDSHDDRKLITEAKTKQHANVQAESPKEANIPQNYSDEQDPSVITEGSFRRRRSNSSWSRELHVSSHSNIRVNEPAETVIQEIQISDQDYVNATQSKAKVSRSDFEILCVIGRGAYGKVYLVEKKTGKDAGQKYAMKVLQKATMVFVRRKPPKSQNDADFDDSSAINLNPKSNRRVTSAEETQVEKNILLQLAHPFIVRLYYSFQTNERLYLILDFVSGGELFSYLAKERMLGEDQASIYLAELVLALEHLHSCGVIYRDLKPENILLDQEGHIKLTDFGLSKVALDGRTTTMCGTLEYMAPEIINEVPYDHAVDWWSLGILAYDMITGNPPFVSNNKKKTGQKICQEKLKIPKYITSDCGDFIRKILKKDPRQRLGANGAAEIKAHRFFRKIDWRKLDRKQITPPIVPGSKPLEEAFSASFRSMPTAESPVEGTPLSASLEALFRGFSYVDVSLAGLDEK